MTGIVVVSHSRALADAAVALAREMAPPEVAIGVAAGLGDGSFGTDAAAIAAVLEETLSAAASGPGDDDVVVLMDLGSAVLSAEMALEFIDPDAADRVLLSPGPLIEGLVVASVAAAAGRSAADVAREAARALDAKAQQLPDAAISDQSDQVAPSNGEIDPAEALTAEFTMTDPAGLHARPAGRLAAATGGFDAYVRLANLDDDPEHTADAASMLELMTLGIAPGHRVGVRVTGPDARAALDALLALVERGFDEPGVPSGLLG